MNDKEKLQEIGKLLTAWESNEIDDWEFCQKVGQLLNLGNWKKKGFPGPGDEGYAYKIANKKKLEAKKFGL